MRLRTFVAPAALGLGLALAAPLTASAAASGTVITVPDDFIKPLSDTRAAGHYEVDGTALHVFTDDATSQAKVAEYIAVEVPLADVGEPHVNWIGSATPPGFQLLFDPEGDGTDYNILVGEPTSYGANWWLTGGSQATTKAKAPHIAPGNGDNEGQGSQWYGTLKEWRTNFPSAKVWAVGFSLGSGVKGDGLITSLTFAGEEYTFAEHTDPTPTPTPTPTDPAVGGQLPTLSLPDDATETAPPATASAVRSGAELAYTGLDQTALTIGILVAALLILGGAGTIFVASRRARSDR